MSLKTKREALASISKRESRVGDSRYVWFDVYIGVDDITGKPVRLYAKSEKLLEARIADFYESRRETNGLDALLTPDQIMDAKMAYRRLEGVTPKVTLLDCAERVARLLEASMTHPEPIGKVYDIFVGGKNEGADKTKTESTTGKFVGTYGRDRMVNDVTRKEIEEYLESNYGGKSDTTYNSHYGYLKTFFNWCVKKHYVEASPMIEIEEKTVAWKEPEYAKVDDVEKLARACEREKTAHPEYLAHFVTTYLCGVRREEELRMASMDDAADIHLEDETVRIKKPKGHTKGVVPRSFQIMPNALAWMRSFDYKAALKLITPKTTQGFAKFAERNGITLVRNGGRHSFITYHVAAFGEPAKTQAMVGTSAKMAAEHYRGLASKRDGERYFSIMPTEVK